MMGPTSPGPFATLMLSSPVPHVTNAWQDVILFSCVRSGRAGLGFVKDLRRLNVALTRARHALYIVGNEAALQQSADWHALISDARLRGCTCDVRLESTQRLTPAAHLRTIPLSLLDGSIHYAPHHAPHRRLRCPAVLLTRESTNKPIVRYGLESVMHHDQPVPCQASRSAA